MIFTSFNFLVFLVFVLALYWALPRQRERSLLLLAGSYLFYGYVHPWFCLLIASSTIVDYFCGLGIAERPQQRRLFLLVSIVFNLSLLGFYKYFNFFIDNVRVALESLGLHADYATLDILLPVGISFYTFQTLSYTIDIHQGKLRPTRNFIDFAVFVSFFPQLVAGPIERARHLLPQVSTLQRWHWGRAYDGLILIFRGFAKKLIVADGAAVFVDKLFLLESPTLPELYVASIAFAIQIFADFSAYTDIARGVAKLFGIDLMENFKAPYAAISPSDFWRRWHISFSSWIRDYLYIPLGGSRVDTAVGYFFVLLTSMGLSGLWHGASWHFVLWGIYHALILFAYQRLGFAGRWHPSRGWSWLLAWLVMIHLTLLGWLIFRTPDMAWLLDALSAPALIAPDAGGLVLPLYLLLLCAVYTGVLLLLPRLSQLSRFSPVVGGAIHAGLLVGIILLFQPIEQDFIYFQF